MFNFSGEKKFNSGTVAKVVDLKNQTFWNIVYSRPSLHTGWPFPKPDRPAYSSNTILHLILLYISRRPLCSIAAKTLNYVNQTQKKSLLYKLQVVPCPVQNPVIPTGLRSGLARQHRSVTLCEDWKNSNAKDVASYDKQLNNIKGFVTFIRSIHT